MSENKTKNKETSDLIDLGAFWKKNKNGKNFLSGKLKIGNREFTAFIFSNNKSKPNQPDYRLTVSGLDEDLIPDMVGTNKKKNTASENESDSNQADHQDDIPF